jgi:hypothetical protein
MFIEQLRSIRSTLRDVSNSDQQFHIKLVGPTPIESGCNEKLSPPETVASIIEDIRGLSDRLYKAAGARHEFVGEFQPTQTQAAEMVRARA